MVKEGLLPSLAQEYTEAALETWSEGAVRSRAPETPLAPRMSMQERKEADQWDKGLLGGAWLSYVSTFSLKIPFDLTCT